MANKHVNAVIVGAGAGGGVVAKVLAEAGLSVVLLERGKWATFEDTTDDELRSQRTTVLGNAYGPDDARYRRVIENPDGSTRIVLPSEGGYNNNAACVGSGTVSYGAMAWRFMPQDFRLKSTYGAPEGSTLDDWPISYDDLEPCYERAEWEIVGRGQPVRAAPQASAAHAALPVQQGGADPDRGWQAPRLASLSGADAAQLDSIQRPSEVHPHAFVLRLRLPDRRQVRHAEHGDSRRDRHGQLRAAHRCGGERDHPRRPRQGAWREILRCQRPPAGADRRPRGGVRLGD